MSKVRSVELITQEVCEVAGKIGFLQYQLEREMPREIEKYMNRMHDLDREGQKAREIQAQAQQAAIDEAKTNASVSQAELPTGAQADTPQTESPTLSVVN